MNKRKEHFQMNNIVRTWKDAAYRQSLSAEEQAMLPANPAGEIELTDAELGTLFGATGRNKQDKDRVEQENDQQQDSTHDDYTGLVNLGEGTDLDVIANLINPGEKNTKAFCNNSQSAANSLA